MHGVGEEEVSCADFSEVVTPVNHCTFFHLQFLLAELDARYLVGPRVNEQYYCSKWKQRPAYPVVSSYFPFQSAVPETASPSILTSYAQGHWVAVVALPLIV